MLIKRLFHKAFKLNEELVRLDVDSSEKSNLIEKEPAQRERLKDLLAAWENEVKAER